MAQQAVNTKSSPLLLSKSILARDSILKRLDVNKNEFDEERTKISQLYQQLQRRVEATKAKQDQQLQELDEKIEHFNEKIKREKRCIYQGKMELWELKNQIMHLEELFQQQQEQEEEQYDPMIGNEGEQFEEADEQDQQQGEQQSSVQPQTLDDIFRGWDQQNDFRL